MRIPHMCSVERSRNHWMNEVINISDMHNSNGFWDLLIYSELSSSRRRLGSISGASGQKAVSSFIFLILTISSLQVFLLCFHCSPFACAMFALYSAHRIVSNEIEDERKCKNHYCYAVCTVLDFACLYCLYAIRTCAQRIFKPQTSEEWTTKRRLRLNGIY